MYIRKDASFEMNNEELMDIDENQPRSGKQQSLHITVTIGTTTHVRIELIKIFKGNFCIPCQQ